MGKAICKSCNKQVTWFAGKGERLANQKCPTCNGPLVGKTAGKPGVAGRVFHCAICGRRRREPRLTTLSEPTVFNGFGLRGVEESRELPLGSKVCTYHRPECKFGNFFYSAPEVIQ